MSEKFNVWKKYKEWKMYIFLGVGVKICLVFDNKCIFFVI